MNIFYLDHCPHKAASYLCDQHVIKMSLESCQMISTCLQLYHGLTNPLFMKPAYINHPANLWIRDSVGNLSWLVRHLHGILHQGRLRQFTVNERHRKILSIAENYLLYNAMFESMTPIALCMPDEYKIPSDPVSSYRQFYQTKALTFQTRMRYTKTEIPHWFTANRDQIFTGSKIKFNKYCNIEVI